MVDAFVNLKKKIIHSCFFLYNVHTWKFKLYYYFDPDSSIFLLRTN